MLERILNDRQIQTVKAVEGLVAEDGNIIIKHPNKWFLRVDLEDPYNCKWYTTVDGTPEGKVKIHSAQLHKGPPYTQIIMEENDLKEDGTYGGIGPYICYTPEGAFISVRDNQRHNGVVTEAPRKTHSSDVKQIEVVDRGMTTGNFTQNQLGETLTNTARVTGADGRLGYVSLNATILAADELPPLDAGGRWQELEEFMVTELDGKGREVVGQLAFLGYIPKGNQEKIMRAQEKLQQRLVDWSK